MPASNSKESTYDIELNHIESFLELNPNCVVFGDFNADVERSHIYTAELFENNDEWVRTNLDRKDYVIE